MTLEEINQVLANDIVRLATLSRYVVNRGTFKGEDARELYELQELIEAVYRSYTEEHGKT